MNLFIPIWLLYAFFWLSIMSFGILMLPYLIFYDAKRKNYPRGKKQFVDEGLLKLKKNIFLTIACIMITGAMIFITELV